MSKDIGLEVKIPSKSCSDIHCPFHGKLTVRGQVLVGNVISNKMEKSVVVERKYEKIIPKYQRYEKRKSIMHAHNPQCINAKIGDIVTITECRPISKTKSFVVVQVNSKNQPLIN